MSAVLKVGIVGCGGIANAHLAAYRAQAGVEVAAVYDVNAEAARAFGAKHNLKPVGSIKELLACGLEAASICTPPGTHLELGAELLAGGLAVLCEKPLEIDPDRAARLAETAARSGRPFMVAYCHRFHPAVMELKKGLAAGRIGEVLLFRNIFAGWLDLAVNHRSNRALSGGGTVIDNGSHSTDLFRHLVGEPVEVTAVTATQTHAVKVEDFGVLLLKTAGGAFGEITCTHSTKPGAARIEVYGTKGQAILEYWDNLQWFDPTGQVERATVPAGPDRFAGEVGHFVECVRAGRTPAVTAADGVRASQVIDAAYRSAQQGRKINC